MAIKVEFTEEEIDTLLSVLGKADWVTDPGVEDLITYLNRRKDEAVLPPCGHDSCRG